MSSAWHFWSGRLHVKILSATLTIKSFWKERIFVLNNKASDRREIGMRKRQFLALCMTLAMTLSEGSMYAAGAGEVIVEDAGGVRP